MIKKYFLKFVWFIHGLCDDYIYHYDYVPKHADKDFWEDDNL